MRSQLLLLNLSDSVGEWDQKNPWVSRESDGKFGKSVVSFSQKIKDTASNLVTKLTGDPSTAKTALAKLKDYLSLSKEEAKRKAENTISSIKDFSKKHKTKVVIATIVVAGVVIAITAPAAITGVAEMTVAARGIIRPLLTRIYGYQEEAGSLFLHDGKLYNLNKALRLVNNREVTEIPVKKMKWISKYIDADPLRVQKADIKAPLLVAEWQGKIVPVDGAHRLTRAIQTGVEKLPARKIMAHELEKCVVHL